MHEYLKAYVTETYPHLTCLLTDKQYEQIQWIDTAHQTNERQPNPSALAFQQQRIFARLNFLFLLRQGNADAYHSFVRGQDKPVLTQEHFAELSSCIQKLSSSHYQQLWVATLTSVSVTANQRACDALHRAMPFDAVDFLAQVMTSDKVNVIYPATAELAETDAFPVMFDTGHFRHMMYVEGSRHMFDKLRQKIEACQFGQAQLDLWFSYWLIDITGFRAQTKELGSAYLNDNTFNAMITMKRHLDRMIQNPAADILPDYLEDRARWLKLPQVNESALFSRHFPAPRFILARISALLRLFSPDEGCALLAGLSLLKDKVGEDHYEKLINTLNPLQEVDEPTPTFGPALLGNLYAESRNYEQAIVIGLPIYRQALEAYRDLRRSGVIESSIPLNLNGIADKAMIKALLNEEKFSVLVDAATGATKLELMTLKDQLTATL